MQPAAQRELDRWVTAGLVSPEQRTAIVAFEHAQAASIAAEGPSLLASAISTVGAAIAIGGVAGVIGTTADRWSSAQAMVAALLASAVTLVAAWQLVRNGWGAPAGLLAFCGLALLPVAFGFGADILNWWPEDKPGTFDDNAVMRDQQRIVGGALLLAIPPGLATVRLGLRQAWMALPAATWFGAVLQLTDPLENVTAVVVQVVLAVTVAGLVTFVWQPEQRGRDTAWWLQLGALAIAAQGIAFSAGEERAIFALLGVTVATLIFVAGMTQRRPIWAAAGALPAVFPGGRLVFEYFEGIGAVLIVALFGLALALLPMLLLRRGQHWTPSRG